MARPTDYALIADVLAWLDADPTRLAGEAAEHFQARRPGLDAACVRKWRVKGRQGTATPTPIAAARARLVSVPQPDPTPGPREGKGRYFGDWKHKADKTDTPPEAPDLSAVEGLDRRAQIRLAIDNALALLAVGNLPPRDRKELSIVLAQLVNAEAALIESERAATMATEPERTAEPTSTIAARVASRMRAERDRRETG